MKARPGSGLILSRLTSLYALRMIAAYCAFIYAFLPPFAYCNCSGRSWANASGRHCVSAWHDGAAAHETGRRHCCESVSKPVCGDCGRSGCERRQCPCSSGGHGQNGPCCVYFFKLAAHAPTSAFPTFEHPRAPFFTLASLCNQILFASRVGVWRQFEREHAPPIALWLQNLRLRN